MFPTNFDTKDITFSEYMENMFNCIIDEELMKAMFDDQFNGRGWPPMKPEFDSNGLRFDIDFLNSIGLLISILPIQAISQFVDYVTYSNYKNDAANFDEEVIEANLLFQGKVKKEYNATALGNLAFIYLNTEKSEVKQKIKNTITAIARMVAEEMDILHNFKVELSIPKTDFKC